MSIRRLTFLLGWDCIAWSVGAIVGTWLRYEGETALMDSGGLVQLLSVAIAAQVVVAGPLRLYQGRYSIGSVEEAVAVSAATVTVGLVAFVAVLLPSRPPVPRSIPLIATLITLAAAVGGRVALRLWRERRRRPARERAHRVIVLGADVEGEQLVRSMMRDPDGSYLPVALLDDDPGAQHRRVAGVSVRGTHRDLGQVARTTGADLLVVAGRDLGAPALRDVTRAAAEAGVGVTVLPPLSRLLAPEARPASGADLDTAADVGDLLGRGRVDVDVNAVAGYLEGRRVLVTGAGGSIGSELCRTIHRFRPAELIMLDRDESALHATRLAVHGTALLDSPDVVLADIRDAGVLLDLFADRHPDVVFHAAALKHLPMLERFPTEAWRTNVIGTRNVLDAALRCGASRFVNISTDKAANPTSVLGRSKRIGERLVATAPGAYLSVRFGNVLGSRGSVLHTFTEQIAAGGPLTITHPDVTRFLMTIPEAVQLVVHAAAIGSAGEVLVLDMGEPVRIADLARRLMRIAGREVDIVFTGLREGEKLHEELFGDGEYDRRPIHPAISQVPVPPLPASYVLRHAERVGPAQAMIDLPYLPVPVDRPGREAPGGPVRPAALLPTPRPAS